MPEGASPIDMELDKPALGGENRPTMDPDPSSDPHMDDDMADDTDDDDMGDRPPAHPAARRHPRRGVAVVTGFALVLGLLGGCGSDGGDEAGGTDQLTRGQQVFTSLATPTCASCHSLADAGATATIGADLDATPVPEAFVASTVRGGSPPLMPSYDGQLSDADIEAVAAYVAEVAGR